MIKDPLTQWDGPFPYDVLAPAGVTPQTPQSAMADVSFELMTRGLMNGRTQQAWDELRTLRRRLLADFLLYDVDPAQEAARVREELAAAGTAAPPELPEAVRVPALPAAWLDGMAGELREVELPEPPEPRQEPGFAPFSLPALIDIVIEFDR